MVFSRRLLSEGGWTPGRQLWRMRLDGSQAAPLTDAPFINHGAPAVGPTGTPLAYLRFDLETPLEPAQIWWFDLETLRESSRRRGRLLAGMDPLARVGEPAPDFVLHDLEGRTCRLADERGRILVLNFWSAECPHSERIDRVPVQPAAGVGRQSDRVVAGVERQRAR